ncbi:hypothetical protein ACTA71_012322 [Dictyostelium dimigraforme]
MSHQQKLFISLEVVYSIGMFTAPVWVLGLSTPTLMMNDSGRFNERFQYGCIYSLLATPFVLSYSLYRLIEGDRRPLVALLPLIPVSSYIACFFAFWKDEKK